MVKRLSLSLIVVVVALVASFPIKAHSRFRQNLIFDKFQFQKTDSTLSKYKFRFAFSAGASRTLGTIPNYFFIEKEFFNKLVIGRVLSLSASYFHFKKIGFGLDLSLNYNSSSGSSSLPMRNINGQIIYEQIPISVQIANYYLAPHLAIRNYFGKNKYQSISSFSFGVVSNNNLTVYLSSNLNSTFFLGSSISQGVDFSINKNVLCGIETKVFIGGFDNIIQATKSSDKMFEFPLVNNSISRVELTLGLRLNSVFEN
jgi:hypothetical protein